MRSVWGIPQSLGIITTFKYISSRQHKKLKTNDHQSFFIYRDALEENHANLDDLEIKIEKANSLLY